MIQGYCYGIVKDGEFMPHIPTTAHLGPHSSEDTVLAAETLSHTSTPDPYNQEVQVALKLKPKT